MKKVLSVLLALLMFTSLMFPLVTVCFASSDSYKFYGKVSDDDKVADLDLHFDTEWFFENPKEYNPELCTLSCILSLLAYGYDANKIYVSNLGDTFIEPVKFLEKLGFGQIKEFDDNQKCFIGNRKIEKDGKEKTLVVVDARGTEKSDWIEVGTDLIITTQNDNHKGFDDAAQTVFNSLNQYMEDGKIDKRNTVFWVTGHSRGAAVASIVSKWLKDEELTCFAYTFASPYLTNVRDSRSNAFNIVNTDDWVTTATSKFFSKRYGNDKAISCGESIFDRENKILITDYLNSRIPYDADSKSWGAHHNLFFYYAECIYFENKTIKVTPNDSEKVFGEDDPELTYKIDSRNKKASDLLSGKLARAAGENAGTYLINQGSLDCIDDSCEFYYKEGGKFTINKAVIPSPDPVDLSYVFNEGTNGPVSIDFDEYIPSDSGEVSLDVNYTGDISFEVEPYGTDYYELNFDIKPISEFDDLNSTVTINVTMQNYENINIVYNLSLVDVPETEPPETEPVEPGPTEETKGHGRALPIALASGGALTLVAGGGAAYYFGFRKKRK